MQGQCKIDCQQIRLITMKSSQTRWVCLNTNASPQLKQNICITFIQRRPNVFDVGPTLYKCYTNVLCLLEPCQKIWFFHPQTTMSWQICRSDTISAKAATNNCSFLHKLAQWAYLFTQKIRSIGAGILVQVTIYRRLPIGRDGSMLFFLFTSSVFRVLYSYYR